MRIIYLLLIVSLGFLLGGVSCATATPGSAEGGQATQELGDATVSQIIIKFRDNTLDPSSTRVLQDLSATAGIGLSYVRQLSMGAHVFSMNGSLDHGQLREMLARLATRPDVEYATPDLSVRHQ